MTHAELRIADITAIDTKNKTLLSAEEEAIAYEQLIFALADAPDRRLQSCSLEHLYELSTASDALRLKGDIIRQAARSKQNPKGIGNLSTFTIFGGGERGSASAIEIRLLL